ncbi:MAG: DUF2569 domain-containing protein [Pseudomonadales bacterium]
MEEKKDLKGLRGWLILVGIGIVFTPIRLILTLTPAYKPMFEEGVWSAITTQGSASYVPHLGSIIIGEMSVNAIVFCLSIYLIYLFFKEHYRFPKLYIALLSFTLAFAVIDAWLVSQLIPGAPMFDSETQLDIMKSALTAAIWIPYLLYSKRVKATFVNARPCDDQPVCLTK